MGKLDGKVAIITGAARGMGAEHARQFVEEGAKVVITDIILDEGEKLSEELGENAIFVKHDVTQPQDWADVINKAKEAFGPVNILVNNAGMAGPAVSITELKDEDYLRVVNIDLHGTYYGVKAILPEMLQAGEGSIINIVSGSGSSHNSSPNAAYTSAKHAVIGLTKAAALEYSGKGIRVNAVSPGGTLTQLMKDSLAQNPEHVANVTALIPMGRMANPSEISKVVVFLASDDASYVTGVDYKVDGGFSLN